MAYNKFQTGGKDRQWLFDPQMIETIAPILSKLVTYDEYFKEEQGTTTLMIVLDKILEELPPELEEAVRLVYLAGVSYRSASRTIGVDHKTVKARAERGIKVMKRRLTDTVWLNSLVGEMLPNVERTKITSPESVLNVLGGINSIRSGYEE